MSNNLEPIIFWKAISKIVGTEFKRNSGFASKFQPVHDEEFDICDFLKILTTEIERNPDLKRKLQFRQTSQEPKVKSRPQKTKPKFPCINVIQILVESGESELSKKLESLTIDEICKIITADKYARSQDIKEKSKEDLITLLIQAIKKRLNQDFVFIKNG